MSKRNPFYNKIIDEWKVASLFDNHFYDAYKPLKRWFFFMVFSMVPPWLIAFSGYSFAQLPMLINWGFALLFAFLAILCGVRYCKVMIKYSIPRKNKYPILFVLAQLLLMVILSAIPYWTTQYERREDCYSVHVNTFPAFLGLVLTVVMVFVHYYAVTNCFKKYYREVANWYKKKR